MNIITFVTTAAKTIAEFALYGDPALCIFEKRNKTSLFEKNHFDKPPKKYIPFLPMPNIREALSIEECKTNEKLLQKITDIVATQMREMENFSAQYEGKIYSISGKEKFLTVFKSRTEKRSSFIYVSHDKRGNILKIVQSK